MYIEPVKKRESEGNGVYKYVVKEDLYYKTEILGISFENEWLSIDNDGLVTVKGSHAEGYAWDGCSPKFNVMDTFLLGIPDGRVIVSTQRPITYYASLIHDILLQFQHEIGITRKQADIEFKTYLGDFKLKNNYYYSVRLFGICKEFFQKIMPSKSQNKAAS